MSTHSSPITQPRTLYAAGVALEDALWIVRQRRVVVALLSDRGKSILRRLQRAHRHTDFRDTVMQ